ncbi:hypothetical protein DYU11_21065 [Fibrisoma montanum]|uniref:Uncharacterized protein n=1 Tax=Fibrisoma montanum TaxID=2305895 RepID=A0A418M456_9BACT|nr:hypothetical protein [Fibrisoma montanum]RIV20538.1 hypothetical protein DYU11_21065 [Fibrisoma montanum]
MQDTLDELAAWLDAPKYEVGVMLYEKHLGTGFLLAMLKKGPDDYNRQKLREALEAKHEQLSAEHQARQSAYPQPLVSSLEQAKRLMDERTILKERMRNQFNSGVTESEELKGWAFRILAIKDELDTIYGRRNFYDQHGYLPEVAAVDAELAPEELVTRRLTLRTYITRYSKKLRGALSEEQMQTYTQKLAQYQSELHTIEMQLDALTRIGST